MALALKKRKLDNFLPLHYKKISFFRKIKTREERVFQNYVFAKVVQDEIFKLKKIDGVINLVYWKGEPVKIKEHEIEKLKEFLNDHENIILEKTKMNFDEISEATEAVKYSISGNLISIKNTVKKINLPSIGYRLVAKADLPDSLESQTAFAEKPLVLLS